MSPVDAFAFAFSIDWPAAAAKPAALPKYNLADVQEKIQSGDLLLYRRDEFCWRRVSTWGAKLIALVGRSDYTHAATVAWWGRDLMVLEVREGLGGRIVSLASQVEKYPGRIDLFTANYNNAARRWDRAGVVAYMRKLAGCRYGWDAIAKAALLHLWFIRWAVKPNVDDESITIDPPFCSQARAMADRIGGGFDPVPNLADQITEPGDLARSTFYRRRFTLVP
jgi:hypothetical protein